MTLNKKTSWLIKCDDEKKRMVAMCTHMRQTRRNVERYKTLFKQTQRAG